MSDTLMVSVSGVRGLVGTDLTPEVVARWAAAFGIWSREQGAGSRKRQARIVLGRDARTSGPMFAAAATSGLVSVGCDVIDVGLVPTPSVQLAVEHHRAAGGIVLTASHNPIEWNALKFVGPDGIFLDNVAGTRVRELAGGGGIPCHEPTTMRSAVWRRIRRRFPAISPRCSRCGESMFGRSGAAASGWRSTACAAPVGP